MSNIAVKVEGLSKQYRIGKQESYRTFRDTITNALTAPARRVAGLLSGNASSAANLTETIWALRDINFEVKHGEVVGIIGRNGAGKSTLLKILSRITEPTEGTIDIFGRVGALLEVGTGFHPELTGRENLYLNGAILGMSRKDIRRKFDEIVDFAGVEKFIDTPVKHYSSGMGLRLGFAVAAHLEPDILIVDEVLAVGDAEFQKKCLGKMGDVAGEGRTVLFVSHNLNQIRRLCETVAWLDRGQIIQVGDTQQLTALYETNAVNITQDTPIEFRSQGFRRWYIDGKKAPFLNQINDHESTEIVFVLDVPKPILRGHHGLVLYDSDGRVAWSAATNDIHLPQPGVYNLRYALNSFPLNPGIYSWFMTFYETLGGQELDRWYAEQPLVVGAPLYTHPMERYQGLLNLPYEFEVDQVIVLS